MLERYIYTTMVMYIVQPKTDCLHIIIHSIYIKVIEKIINVCYVIFCSVLLCSSIKNEITLHWMNYRECALSFHCSFVFLCVGLPYNKREDCNHVSFFLRMSF